MRMRFSPPRVPANRCQNNAACLFSIVRLSAPCLLFPIHGYPAITQFCLRVFIYSLSCQILPSIGWSYALNESAFGKGVEGKAHSRAVPRLAAEGDRAAILRHLLEQQKKGQVPLRGMRLAFVCVGQQVRVRYWLALVLFPCQQSRDKIRDRQGTGRAKDRSALLKMRRASRSCF